jgi:hypothetical protein
MGKGRGRGRARGILRRLRRSFTLKSPQARVAEQVDAEDLKFSGFGRAGSSPAPGTKVLREREGLQHRSGAAGTYKNPPRGGVQGGG